MTSEIGAELALSCSENYTHEKGVFRIRSASPIRPVLLVIKINALPAPVSS